MPYLMVHRFIRQRALYKQCHVPQCGATSGTRCTPYHRRTLGRTFHHPLFLYYLRWYLGISLRRRLLPSWGHLLPILIGSFAIRATSSKRHSHKHLRLASWEVRIKLISGRGRLTRRLKATILIKGRWGGWYLKVKSDAEQLVVVHVFGQELYYVRHLVLPLRVSAECCCFTWLVKIPLPLRQDCKKSLHNNISCAIKLTSLLIKNNNRHISYTSNKFGPSEWSSYIAIVSWFCIFYKVNDF